jgi:hypothetical protein
MDTMWRTIAMRARTYGPASGQENERLEIRIGLHEQVHQRGHCRHGEEHGRHPAEGLTGQRGGRPRDPLPIWATSTIVAPHCYVSVLASTKVATMIAKGCRTYRSS